MLAVGGTLDDVHDLDLRAFNRVYQMELDGMRGHIERVPLLIEAELGR